MRPSMPARKRCPALNARLFSCAARSAVLALQHAAARLGDDPVGQATEVLDVVAHARDAGGPERLAGLRRPGRRARRPGRRHDARGDLEEIAVLARLLPRPLRGGQAADLLHAAPRPARVIGKSPEGARHVLAQALHQAGDHAYRIPEQRTVRGPMNVGRHHGRVDAELGAILEAKRNRGLDDGVVEGADRGRGQAAEGAVEGVVLGHGGGVEGREDPERVAVGDALAQFAEIPRLHPLEHEGAEDLDGAQAVAPGLRALELAHQIGVDQRDELFGRVQKVGEGLQGRVQRDALGLQFVIGEAEGADPRPHGTRARRCAIRNARWAPDIAWLSCLSRLASSTQAATSARKAIGTCSVRVVPFSFQVNSAVSWSGPSVAHRHAGRPHRLVLTVREPSRKGPRVRRRVRICRPAELVRGRAMRQVYLLTSTTSTKHPTHGDAPEARECSAAHVDRGSGRVRNTSGRDFRGVPATRALRWDGLCAR
jgi:hypothetical protein